MKNIVTIIAFSFFSLGACAQAIGSLYYVRGDVEVLRNGQTLQGGKGLALQADDLLITDQGSLAVVSYKNGSKIKLDGESQLHLKTIKDDGAPNGGLKLNLLRGSFLMNFNNPNHEQSVGVEAGRIAMGVRGTRFFMGLDDDGQVSTAVDRGQVEVFNTSLNDSEVIDAGKTVMFDKNGALTKPNSFGWTKQMNWSTDGRSGGSKFNSQSLRQARKSQFQNALSRIRNRAQRPISGQMKSRLAKRLMNSKNRQNIMNRMKERSNIAVKRGWVKGKMKKKVQKRLKNKDQQKKMRDRLKNRKNLRRTIKNRRPPRRLIQRQ